MIIKIIVIFSKPTHLLKTPVTITTTCNFTVQTSFSDGRLGMIMNERR